MIDIFEIILKIAFCFLSVLLIAIVLLQEGQGGGLGGAFGGVGGQAFGHGAGGINRFTAIIAGTLMVVTLLIALLPRFA